jgi:hypothetical protein
MNHFDFLFYVLGAIQLGSLTKIKGLGNPSKLINQKIKLVQNTPIKPDDEGSFHVRQKSAYDLFQVIVWFADHDGMELSVESIEKAIFHLIDDKSIYSFGESSMGYYLLGAYNLCPIENIVITQSKLHSLPKLENTDLYKNIMFLFEADRNIELTEAQLRNILPTISNYIDVLESKIARQEPNQVEPENYALLSIAK